VFPVRYKLDSYYLGEFHSSKIYENDHISEPYETTRASEGRTDVKRIENSFEC
jgi:hypothetical protein